MRGNPICNPRSFPLIEVDAFTRMSPPYTNCGCTYLDKYVVKSLKLPNNSVLFFLHELIAETSLPDFSPFINER